MSVQPQTFSSNSRYHGIKRVPNRKRVVLIRDLACVHLDHHLCSVERDTRDVMFRCGCECHKTTQTRLF